MWNPPPEHPLRRLFAGYTEHTFQLTFGLADPPLVDYLSGLLCRFLHSDAIHRIKDADGRPLDQVAEMFAEVADMPPSRTRREAYRHIGDFALFWTGVYPENLRRMHRRQAQAGAVGFGRKIRRENLRLNFGIYTGAVVLKFRNFQTTTVKGQ